jgi:predicted membrane protein
MNLAIILMITNFLRTLFVILIIWYGIKLVTKFVLPMMLHKTVKNMQSRVENQFRKQPQNGRPEGEVTVENKQGSNGNKFQEGEYVDFEEVE